MEKEALLSLFNNKTRIKINLKNGLFYSGVILELRDTSLIFKDKYDNEIPISLDSISYVIPIKVGGYGHGRGN